MRVHLPALLALVSAASYVACGSSDNAKTDQEGGAAGQGGESIGSGGTQSSGGTKNTGASSSFAGQGGEPALGGMPSTGAGGAEGGVATGLGGAGGEGGSGEPVVDPEAFPAACPGAVTDYVALDGGAEADTFTAQQLDQTVPNGPYSQVFARGFAGDDIFEYNNAGADCLLGGDGDDDFSIPGEYGSVMVGGGGADVFHLRFEPSNNASTIVDMSNEDTIGVSIAEFSFLYGQTGANVDAGQLYSITDYEAGTGNVPSGEGAALVYDPATGGLWVDGNRATKDGGEVLLLEIGNPGSYTFDINDFVIDP